MLGEVAEHKVDHSYEIALASRSPDQLYVPDVSSRIKRMKLSVAQVAVDENRCVGRHGAVEISASEGGLKWT